MYIIDIFYFYNYWLEKNELFFNYVSSYLKLFGILNELL